MAEITVRGLKVTRKELAVPELAELFGLERLPLAPAHVTVDIAGIPTQGVNALRRVLTDEMTGHALEVPIDGFSTELTTDVFMLPQFVNQRIGLLPLRPRIDPETVRTLRLRLDVSNRGASVRTVYAADLEIAAGAMPEPLFNPTTELAFIQPGKRLVITGIFIAEGVGRDDGKFNVACRAAYRHLDIPQFSEDEMRSEDGVAADLSGYKVSSLVADPRSHRLTFVLPAATAVAESEARAVLVAACVAIKDRFRLLASAVDSSSQSYTVVTLESGLSEGTLFAPGETHTTGALLARIVSDQTPDVSNVSYTPVSHENQLRFTVRHSGDVTSVIRRGIKTAIEMFDTLQRGFSR